MAVVAQRLVVLPAQRARAVEGRRWLHVGQGYFHDMVPARSLGLPNAWINRNGDTPEDGGAVEREFPTLRELADWLAPAR